MVDVDHLAMQLASEGFFPLYGAISYVILILLLLTGKKLISVMNDVVKRVYDRFDKDNDKHISSSELDALEHDLADNLSGIEPNFWFGRPKLVMYLIRVIMWQNSQTLCLSVFYWYWKGQCFRIYVLPLNTFPCRAHNNTFIASLASF